jgi:1-deoxyxylulose-5-phosphate synthase
VQYVRLGSSGLQVSRICLGMMSYGSKAWRDWMLDEHGAEPIVRRAVEQGIIFFDTADVYSLGESERITGRLLGTFFNHRDDYVLATKLNSPMGGGPNDRGLSRKHIMASIDASLQRLGTDYVDLYQIHRWDSTTPIEETLHALADVVHAGKARYLGASSMYAWQFAKAQYTARLHGLTEFITMQNHYNLLYREEEREMVPLCQDLGVGIIPWSPLARGRLTRSRHPDAEAEAVRDPRPATIRAGSDTLAEELYRGAEMGTVDVLVSLAEERGVPPAQVALAWLFGKAGVTAPIIGATKTRHVDDAVGALEVALTEEEVERLERPYRPLEVRGHSW